MSQVIQSTATVIKRMDEHLRHELLKKDGAIQRDKLWENTYIKRQIDKRQAGGIFSISDHIRAMVYSMLGSGTVWDRVSSHIDEDTKQLIPIDEVFHQYDPERILQCDPEQLSNEIQKLRCASPYTAIQMQALIHTNIPKLIQFESEHGSIDAFYQEFIGHDPTLKTLVKALSAPHSDYKLAQMGEALVAEYLKNAGYDMAKPDRHIRRILGSRILGCSTHEIVPIFEAFDIVATLAKELNRPAAEVDYILWSYCANGYGAICTSKNPKCGICVAHKGVCPGRESGTIVVSACTEENKYLPRPVGLGV